MKKDQVKKVEQDVNVQVHEEVNEKVVNVKKDWNDYDDQIKSYVHTSTRIRFLLSKNWTRSNVVNKLNEINESLGIKKRVIYQHVRNVEVTPITNQKEKF